MGAFGGLERLFSDRVDGYAPIDDKFVRPDRKATAKAMQVAEHGEEQGKLDLPPTDAKDPDHYEREVISTVREHLNKAHIDAGNSVTTYEGRLGNLSLLYGTSAIKGEVARTLGDIKLRVKEWDDTLSTHRENIRLANRELKAFRAAHNLDRPYHLVESPWVHFALILGAFLLETGGNTIFLSVNNQMGIAGGIAAAMLVSLINVGVSTFAGIFIFPRTNLKAPGKRSFAYVLAVLWFLAMVVWNAFAGHFRDAQSAGHPNPDEASLTLLLNSPLGFEGFNSWAMFIIGMVAAAFSAYEGYRANDPYPGYGALGKQYSQREALYADLLAEAREQLAEERDRAIEKARSVKDQLDLQNRARSRILSDYKTMVHRFEQHHSQLEDLANSLIKQYQDANRKARSTPAPAYFDQPVKLPRPGLAELTVPDVDDAQVEAAGRELDAAIEQVATAFDEAIESFVSLDELKKEGAAHGPA